ncbi:hypothetical protein, partial [Burkholderia cenocepacia]|uniref:hypothetical protein n=3 Tax=Burkholderia cepacia complex TaxID=87882 RepID=UPI001ABADC0A
ASLSSAQDHEHDISNAPPSAPVYTVPNFNSLLGPAQARHQCEQAPGLHAMAGVSAGDRTAHRRPGG